MSLSGDKLIQPTPAYPIPFRLSSVLQSNIIIDPHRGLFPSRFPTEILFAFFLPHARPSNYSLLSHPNNI